MLQESKQSSLGENGNDKKKQKNGTLFSGGGGALNNV